MTVTNTGPGAVSGVTVHAVLPSGFTYRSTTDGDACTTNGPCNVGVTRTQPLTADVNSSTPLWGVWDLGAPGAAGPGIISQVQFTFTMQVEGSPGKPLVSAYAVGNTAAGQVNAAPFPVEVVAAAHLGIQATVSPSAAKSGASVVYQVRILNTGTDAAEIAVLITLPPGLTFTSSILPFAGNASLSKGAVPAKNAVLVYYDGYTLPANSQAGPGFLVIQFKATVVANAVTGSNPIDVSVTDSKGDIAAVHAVAPLTIQPGSVATPTPSFAAAAPASTPAPSLPVVTPTAH